MTKTKLRSDFEEHCFYIYLCSELGSARAPGPSGPCLRPEQAFAQWESTYCKPSLDVVLLAKQVKAARDKHHQEYTGKIADLVRREETIKLREDFAADKQSRMSRGLQEDRHNLSEEQRVWRLAQAQKLRGVELRPVQRIWQEQEEQKVRTWIWDEARSDGYVAAHQDMNVENAAKCAQSRQECISEGYQTGYRKEQEVGRREAWTDFRANLDQARAKGLAEANEREAEEVEEIYNRGYAAGISEGDRQGRAKGFEGSEISREETFFRPFHWAVRIIPTWAADDRREVLNHDGTADVTCLLVG